MQNVAWTCDYCFSGTEAAHHFDPIPVVAAWSDRLKVHSPILPTTPTRGPSLDTSKAVLGIRIGGVFTPNAQVHLSVHARHQNAIRVRYMNFHKQRACRWVKRISRSRDCAMERTCGKLDTVISVGSPL